MKTPIFAIAAALALLPAALGQTLPPSPTASVGCEPHGDHWHCDGPVETATGVEEATTETLAPSPTESVGCEPHGDHWHCDGPAETATDAEDATTETLAPSPTESVGCEPHGDHWHCDGPATATADNSLTPSDASPTTEPTGGAALGAVPIFGALMAAVLAF